MPGDLKGRSHGVRPNTSFTCHNLPYGDFPKPFSVFGRKLWLEQDVLDWLSAREQSLLKQIEKRRGHGKAKGEQITEEAAL